MLDDEGESLSEPEAAAAVELNGASIPIPDELRDITLLDFIRDHVGLKGTKFGCGMGICGACTVHVEGDAVRSCALPVSAAAGKRVTTIEGLGVDGLHPVQEAWIAEAVPQCGYCQAGQIMSAAALLAQNPRPTEAEIRTAMDGNLCRCGTYLRIRRAVQRAAGRQQVRLPSETPDA